MSGTATRHVIDADGHVREPDDIWHRYVPEAVSERMPRKVAGENPYWVIDGVEVPPRRSYAKTTKNLTAWNEERFRDAAADHYSPTSQLRALDAEGIMASVLFPSAGLVVMGIDRVDPVVTTTMATAYNTWLAEFCAEGQGRLFGTGMVDPRDVDGAVAEARRCAELGFVGVFLRPNPVHGRVWHDQAYEPLWSTLEELDLPVCFHEGGSVHLPQVATDRFDEHAFWHICTHPLEQMMAMVSVLLGGVAERHPPAAVRLPRMRGRLASLLDVADGRVGRRGTVGLLQPQPQAIRVRRPTLLRLDRHRRRTRAVRTRRAHRPAGGMGQRLPAP
jgi:predicted TIM-barrel fold metal-dependent hydrolase